MLTAVLSGFVAAVFAPLIHRAAPKKAGWVIALLPLALFVYFLSFLSRVGGGEVVPFAYEWVPRLGVRLSFLVDGLGLLFALIISGIGALVVIYGGGYLAGHREQGYFFAYVLAFMASMLGVVLSDNIIALFIFWELTSLSSYFLIGFYHERQASRSAALQALLVTGLGGLAMLAGLILLGRVGGSWEVSSLVGQSRAVGSSELYPAILVLILLGAFTKSAQFPFHFWLPNAMEAPAPVSAYLHSATMVKAGVYLLARMSPVLGGTHLWLILVTGFGAVTMLGGAMLAVLGSDLKRVLAYSTISALGMLVFLLGLGTDWAAGAAMAFLLGHALYKGAFFLIIGSVDHESGTRDVTRLGGLRKAMPLTALAAIPAGLSMAGLPPLFGFIGKEQVYESLLHAPGAAGVLTAAAVLASMLFVVVAGLCAVRPFWGGEVETPKRAHEAPPSMWLGPVVLGALSLLFGLLPGLVGKSLIASSASAIAGRPIVLKLALWHGLSPALGLSAVTLAGGLGLLAAAGGLRRIGSRLQGVFRYGPERGYQLVLDGTNAFARLQTRLLQSGYLRYYLLMIVAITIWSCGYTLFTRGGLHSPSAGYDDLRFYEFGLGVLILLAALAAVRSRSRLGAIASLGVVGYGVALVYILYGASDLAMTQFLVETLTVILFVLVFYHLPRFRKQSRSLSRLRDAIIALAFGGLMTLLVLMAVTIQFEHPISEYYTANSAVQAQGRNIVNVILVDFRGFDTMGEITVLAVAGIGVFALLKLRLAGKESKE